MAIFILASDTLAEGSKEFGSPAKVRMGRSNSSVNDVDIHTGTGGGREGIREYALAHVKVVWDCKGGIARDTGETPRSISLLEGR
jgi:hypothetical protein